MLAHVVGDPGAVEPGGFREPGNLDRARTARLDHLEADLQQELPTGTWPLGGGGGIANIGPAGDSSGGAGEYNAREVRTCPEMLMARGLGD